MGNNNSSASHPAAGAGFGCGPPPLPGAPQRTRSLPVCHQDHGHHCQGHGHSQQHHQRTGGAGTGQPSSCRSRRALLPSLVSNVSTAFARKFSHRSGGGSAGGGTAGTAADSNNKYYHYHYNHHRDRRGSGGGGGGGKRSRSKTREHRRLFRQVVNEWSLSDLHCLVVEFESALAVRELRARADAARPIAGTLKDDLAKLYRASKPGTTTRGEPKDSGSGGLGGCDDPSADTILVLDGRRGFAVHRAFLSVRCPFFHRLLHHQPGNRPAAIQVTFPSWVTPLNADELEALLEYLYTGEEENWRRMTTEATNDHHNKHHQDGLRRAGGGGGGRSWSTLEEDVETMWHGLARQLLPEEQAADAVLVFTTDAGAGTTTTTTNFLLPGAFGGAGGAPHLLADYPAATTAGVRCCKFPCHSLVLAARSPFFRAIIQKRRRELSAAGAEVDIIGSGGGLIEIVLDEAVLPRRFAPALLKAMYTDQVDLSLVTGDVSASASNCLNEVKAIAAGQCLQSPIDLATELYQIARFLEYDKLAQGCEDAIVCSTNLDNLCSVYNWAVESYGSDYVRRRCVEYLCLEFGRFLCAPGTPPILLEASEQLLVDVLRSDYVQASESDILVGVIRWGEHQLARRLEEREPNLLAGTTHSISRKGVRRADLSDEELRDVLANLLPLVRVDYILPPNHPVLENAITRGLLTTSHDHWPPMTLDKRRCSPRPADAAAHPDPPGAAPGLLWSQPHGPSAGPRLFLPFLFEARSLLEKRLAETPDRLSYLINHHPPVQTVSAMHLHMAATSSMTTGAAGEPFGGGGGLRFPDNLYMVDQGGGLGDSELNSLPESTINWLTDRIERVLTTSGTVRRAITCGCSYHKGQVLKLIRLRAVRERGLPDSAVLALEMAANHNHYHNRSPAAEVNEEESSLSVVSSPKVQPLDWSYCAAGPDEEDPRSPPTSGRRFRSQPELYRWDCCRMECSSDGAILPDWPDLMRSSIDAGSLSRRSYDLPSLSSPAASADAGVLEDGDGQKEDWSTAGSGDGGQQLADLTQRICDLVVMDDDPPSSPIGPSKDTTV